MENIKIFGQRLLVEQLLEDIVDLGGTKKEFRGRVKVLALPTPNVSFAGIGVGDELIVTGFHTVWDEKYVVDNQIIRWV